MNLYKFIVTVVPVLHLQIIVVFIILRALVYRHELSSWSREKSVKNLYFIIYCLVYSLLVLLVEGFKSIEMSKCLILLYDSVRVY